jgi:predicted transcriptional regulator
MAKPQFALKEPYGLSMTELDIGDFVVVSRNKKASIELIFIGTFNAKKSFSILKDDLFRLVAEYSPLNAVEVRAKLSIEQKNAMTWHLLQVQKNFVITHKSAQDELSWRYSSLLTWGESAAAKVIANEDGISVRTVHSRLRLAREKGYLDSPGSGARLGTD